MWSRLEGLGGEEGELGGPVLQQGLYIIAAP